MNNLPNNTNVPKSPSFLNTATAAAENAADKITNAKIEKLRAEQAKTARQIADAERAIEQDENKIKRLTNSLSQAERKARTRRLIERGAIAESFIPNADVLSNDEFKAILVCKFSSECVAAIDDENPQARSTIGLV